MSKVTHKGQKNKRPLITAALDFGGSATKVIYENTDGEVKSLVMEPEVATVPVESIKNYGKNSLGWTEPENRAWIYLPKTPVVQVVGYLAKDRYYANAGLEELKYERGVYKTLTAVWAIKEKLQLPPRLQVALAVLLPPGEFEDKEQFEAVLRNTLLNYLTPTGQMNVELAMFRCLPEGAGIYLMHEKKVGAALKQRVCALTMIGYRNASVLISNRGMVKEGKTSDLGMVRMVEKVVAATSGQTLERLTPAIAAAGADIDQRILRQLTRSKTQEGQASEIQKLENAIASARAEYTAMLTSWLDNVLPNSVDEIVFCGGTADYLMKELNEHYPRTPLSWNASIEIPASVDVSGLGSRLCDVYSLFLYFHGVVEAQLGTLPKSGKEGIRYAV